MVNEKWIKLKILLIEETTVFLSPMDSKEEGLQEETSVSDLHSQVSRLQPICLYRKQGQVYIFLWKPESAMTAKPFFSAHQSWIVKSALRFLQDARERALLPDREQSL